MSSAAGLEFSQADFLARWMPDSSRAGVILGPCTVLSSSLRQTSAEGPNDSFVSDFAPLPASADSSCVAVDGCPSPPGGDTAGSDRPLNSQSPDGELDPVDQMESQKQPPTLMMKLEQLRKWQHHMQEQLKAQQLEELLRLQEEQHRLLGRMNGSQDYAAGSTQTEGYDEEEDSSLFYQQSDILQPNDGEAMTEDCDRREDDVCNDRPIKGQKKTFEELLEEQLKLEEQRLKTAEQQVRESNRTHQQQKQFQSQTGADTVLAAPKRAFLKRGEGLSRFTKRTSFSSKAEEPKLHVLAKVISRSNSEPAVSLRGSRKVAQRLPVQRKTASLNKENRQRGFISPSQQIASDRGAERTKVLGSHQRQNTDRPASVHTDQEVLQNKPPRERVGLAAQSPADPEHKMLPRPVTKQGGTVKAPTRSDNEDSEKSRRSAEKETQSSAGEVSEEVFELSFQDKLQRWECDQHTESMELGEFELLERAAEEHSFSSNSSFVAKILQMDRTRASQGLPPRRLSSTPVKSPPKGALRRCSSLGSGGLEECKDDFLNSGNFAVRNSALKNKASIEDAKEERHLYAEIWPCGGYSFEGQEVQSKPPSFPESTQPYDKRSYQDNDSASEASQSDDAEGKSLISTAESTLMEDKDEHNRVVFDDNDTWNDQEESVVAAAGNSDATARGSSPPERAPLRKVAVTGSASQESDPPPASQLMARLFPSLKPKALKAPLPIPPAPESTNPQEETGQNVQSRLLRERLAELEIEIERFKKENAALAKLRQENEKNQDILRKERLEFEQMKAAELAKFEEYKKEEIRKLQKERRIFERHASAARAIPDKKEREEIQLLKQQLSSLQEELKGKESRWACTHNRLRQQTDSLRQENASLRDEIRVLEKLRLNTLKNNLANADKVHEISPKTPENSTPTASKGVKFASPLDSRGSGHLPQNSTAAATRRNSKEGGIKSSLRKPASPDSASASLPRTQERFTTSSKSQEKSSNPENSHSCSLKLNVLLNEPQCSELKKTDSADEVISHADGKTEKVLANGERLIVFPNGTSKEVSADGQTVKVSFFNGDTKEITDQRVIYFYAEAQTTHITYPDGMEVLHFPNDQTEKHFPDGRKEITFPDQTVKNLFPDGREESVLTDGTVIQVNPDGTKEIHFNTGQREIHTADYKRREYPDGTVKTVYNDGRQETRYPTGRLRVKDKDGNVVVDSRV